MKCNPAFVSSIPHTHSLCTFPFKCLALHEQSTSKPWASKSCIHIRLCGTANCAWDRMRKLLTVGELEAFGSKFVPGVSNAIKDTYGFETALEYVRE